MEGKKDILGLSQQQKELNALNELKIGVWKRSLLTAASAWRAFQRLSMSPSLKSPQCSSALYI